MVILEIEDQVSGTMMKAAIVTVYKPTSLESDVVSIPMPLKDARCFIKPEEGSPITYTVSA